MQFRSAEPSKSRDVYHYQKKQIQNIYGDTKELEQLSRSQDKGAVSLDMAHSETVQKHIAKHVHNSLFWKHSHTFKSNNS